MKNLPEASEKVLRFFRWFCHPDFQEEFEGDLLERFHQTTQNRGERAAQWNLFWDVLSLFRLSLIRPFHPTNHFIMFRQNLKISWRTLLRNKGFSFINISGLALGMSVAMLIGLWLQDELQYDSQFEHRDQIARVMQHRTFGGDKQTWINTMYPLAEVLRADYGHLFQTVAKGTYSSTSSFTSGTEVMYKPGVFMEPSGINMLSVPMLEGTVKSLEEPGNILISQAFSKALYGEGSALGQTLIIDETPVKISGIYTDFPDNNSFNGVEYLASWVLYDQISEWIGTMEYPWRPNGFQTLVQLADNTSLATANEAIKNVIAENTQHLASVAKSTPETFLHPMNKWYLESRFENGINTGGRIDNVWMFGLVGAFILLLACINFMNLSTARSEKRAKEVGVRKVLGSARSQLVTQFYSESVLFSLLAFLLALGLTYLALPGFNGLADKTISIPWASLQWWSICVIFILLTGILAGSYPALHLSSIGIFRAFRTSVYQRSSLISPRRVLVVIQFTVAVSLIVGVLIVQKQVEYGKNRPTGYAKEQLLIIPFYSNQIREHLPVVEEQLRALNGVKEFGWSSSPITESRATSSSVSWRGKDPEMGVDFSNSAIDVNFGNTVKWQIKAGRDFSPDLASDSSSIILNEQAVRIMGFDDAIGETVEIYGDQYQVIGVVDDILFDSPFEAVRPYYYYLSNHGQIMHLRLDASATGETEKTLAQIEAILKKKDPNMVVEFSFVDEQYDYKIRSEVRTGNLVGIFTLIAIFISCLGLLGLVAYVAECRRKEIGIRKVLGASIMSLWQMLTKEFLLLVVISFAIAIPISYYFLTNWLEQYTYHIELSWQVFALAGGSALFVTLITISFQTIKAARANPAVAIQTE